MKLSKKVQRILMTSAIVLVLSAGQAMAVVDTPFGDCDGSGGDDCTSALGHASVSVTGTLTINEQRAISFGNFASGTTPTAADSVVLATDGSRTVTGANFVALNGADASPTALTDGATGSDTEAGSQSPGHFTVEGGNEDATTATQIYISFADANGNPIDMCTSGGACDEYHTANVVSLTSPAGGAAGDLTMDDFTINESGSDVYGHYIDNSGAAVGDGTANPFLNDRTNPTAVAGVVDVVVGATLHGTGAALQVGKYTGTFIVMASY